MMKTCVFVMMMAALAMAGGVFEQDAKPPALLAKGKNGKSAPLGVDKVAVQVSVVGNVAETVMTIRFENQTDRVLEGELIFPFGEGRTVSGEGLQVGAGGV